MPRDFRSFINENQQKKSDNNYEDLINKYKDMPQNELMSNLLNEASKLKNEGKIDETSLNNLRVSLSPFLNTEQQEMLNSIIDAINKK